MFQLRNIGIIRPDLLILISFLTFFKQDKYRYFEQNRTGILFMPTFWNHDIETEPKIYSNVKN